MSKSEEQNQQHSSPEEAPAPDLKAIPVRVAMLGVGVVVVGAVVLAIVGILPRWHADDVLAERTKDLAAPSVVALPVQPGAPVREIVLPANANAYTDAPVYARTNGYLTKWYFDLGAKVKKGALLATIATPEVDQQLEQAIADLATAKANAANARANATRYEGLVSSDAVSKQDTETFQHQADATSSSVLSAEANVRRLKDLQSFEKVYAPFDGVITARNVDTGQLVNEGAGATLATELFHVQAVQTLRVYVNVPQTYTPAIHKGDTVDLTLSERPDEHFKGVLVRTADSIDTASRTLLVEVDEDNHDGRLLPGALVQAHFKMKNQQSTFVLPVAALIFRQEGLRVATVVNDVAHLKPIVIGQDDGRTVQVISGLTAGDKVMQNPPDSVTEGEKVHVLTADEMKKAGN